MKIVRVEQKNTAQQKVTKDMLIGDIVQRYPEAVQVMLEAGLHCVGCHVATWETLEQGAAGHGIDPDKLVDEINKKVGKK